MAVDNAEELDEHKNYVLPRSIPYLSDNGQAHDLVDSLRWDSGQPHCPRCASKFTKRVNTNVFRQLYRCVDCGYMFNSLSGTIFHGSKLPVYKYFHFFILHNALQDEITIRDLCFALDCSFKTASLWLKRGAEIQTSLQFAVLDKALSSRLNQDYQANTPKECEPFFSFCDMKSVVVHEPTLIEYIRYVAQSNTISSFIV